MANKNLFTSVRGQIPIEPDTYNNAGGVAYKMSDKHALAQIASTGCLNDTFYVSGKQQLDNVIDLCKELDSEYIGQVAIFARQTGYMKDMPALLCAILISRMTKTSIDIFTKIFPKVIDNEKMLRTFMQIARSGVTGRKSLGRAPQRVIRQWLDSRNNNQIFRGSIGKNPSMSDIIKMIHPKPLDETRRALYGYIIGKEYNFENLPELVKHFEDFKSGKTTKVPNVPFQMLDGLKISNDIWMKIAKNAGWHMTRMNLNTFQRHDVFKSDEMVELIAKRLSDKEEIEKSRVFPYQIMNTYFNATDVPFEIGEALQTAMEIACHNVPIIDGNVFVFPDVSASMRMSVTGYRRGSSSKVKCIDVAALVSACILRSNPRTKVIPFERDIVDLRLNPRDSIMTNSERLSAIGGGGTNCSAPLRKIKNNNLKIDLGIYISDYESWIDNDSYKHTKTLSLWNQIKSKNPKARLICIDVIPNKTVQATNRQDIMNIGGFSDQVMSLISDFSKGLSSQQWVDKIESIII